MEPLTSAIPAASHYSPPEDLRKTRPVHRQPPPPPPQQRRDWRDVPPPRRQLPPVPSTRPMDYDYDGRPPETYGPDGYPSQQQPQGPQPHGPQPHGPQPHGAQPQGPQPTTVTPGPPVPPSAAAPGFPKKLTVTRVAAIRGKELSGKAAAAFKRAVNADGADKSGLTALTYATMLNYASDAAMAVALANTLFFSAASADSSKGKVALYLLITIAPFALLAPVIGPMLDRIQRGRRLAMCVTSVGQALACIVMATNFDTWLLYPAALAKMVLSKSFTVLKAAVTPRVVPPDITLAKTNARLTTFGLVGGAAFGAVATLVLQIFDSAGALWFTAIICVFGAVQAMRIPAWVEVTEGEVPASLSAHPEKPRRQPMGRNVVVALSGNATIRVLTGFLMMFAAFAVRAQTEGEPFMQLLLLGIIAGAAGAGSFIGNGIGARMHLGHPDQIVLTCISGSLAATLVAMLLEGIATAAIVGLVGATASALAKNSLDAVIQDDLPEESRASAFGRSETVLQLAWVFGGALGVLLPPTFWLGFLVISVILAFGLVQTMLTRKGQSLLPWFGGERPVRPWRTSTGPQQVAFQEGPPPPPQDRT
ncbi:MFS family permease [Actinophytocola algeriensis]|uniref:MFS family permease n=1 Tax=Actinophytocola algeriensis TaxID=1768010 RepID=A0A7W7VJY0_9PSEU|nr:MFS family permease [Actinophytocola algeriensis]MBE1478899.1 MFS family permease [Actinophytocola algeriensis]